MPWRHLCRNIPLTGTYFTAPFSMDALSYPRGRGISYTGFVPIMSFHLSKATTSIGRMSIGTSIGTSISSCRQHSLTFWKESWKEDENVRVSHADIMCVTYRLWTGVSLGCVWAKSVLCKIDACGSLLRKPAAKALRLKWHFMGFLEHV